ncbi:MAG: adenylate/guanylate cyclase domain-containing protein [Oscillatoria sp. PMC 1068.18]|nr:adenylate/guanylate cyclase domain-containing protein [Oscillatoria sp. PMC 1076.18]MEC4988812.1 adenylate/guanylate cyclase domain-containing protein [Oscillatoria sp. PMC 1068.18]
MNIKNILWQGRGIWITTPCVALLVILVRWVGLLQTWEWAVFDQYLRLRQSPPSSAKRVAIVGIDEKDIEQIGQGIVPDAIYAQLLTKLKQMEPKAIGLDIYRDLPVEPGNQDLVAVFGSTPNLIGVQKVVGTTGVGTVAPPPMLKEKGQVASNDLIVDADNRVRRSLIYLDRDGERFYSLGFYLALLYLDAEGIEVETLDENRFRLGETTFTPLTANYGGYIRTQTDGYQLLLNYQGARNHFEVVPLRKILNDQVDPDWGRDRVILIGSVGESFKDLFYTPHSGGLLVSPEPMPGVEIHANLTSHLISLAKGEQDLIKSWAEPGEWLWIFFWAGVGATLAWIRRDLDRVSSFSWQKLIYFLCATGILFGTTLTAFLFGWWLPVVPPFLAFSGAGVAVIAYIARSASEIRKTFGRYLSDEVVTNLLDNPEGLKLGGERRKLTILTSDLRGFTATSERLAPEEVVKILNFYLEYMADVITKYGGTIDEFMGDGILVLFGAPTPRKDDAERAVATAVAMQLAMEPVNQQMQAWNLPPLQMGIGINTGEVVVGNIGSEKRTKYGVVGSHVNLTYRIESYTTGGQILISESTFNELDSSQLRIDDQMQVQPKGVQEPITIYDLGGIAGKYNLSLVKEKDVFKPLSQPIPLEYTILEGKHLGVNIFSGRIVQLSANAAEVRSQASGSDTLPSPLTNIKLNLFNEPEKSEDIYAKVLSVTIEERTFLIRFTSKPPQIEAKITNLYQSLK